MDDTEALFDRGMAKLVYGRVRRGLEHDVRASTGRDLDAGLLAACRVLADHLDFLERIVRDSRKPYDRIPLASLAKQYGDTYSMVFGGDPGDPFEAAFAELAAAEAAHPAD